MRLPGPLYHISARRLRPLLLALFLGAATLVPATAGAASPALVTAFPLPAAPQNVAVESPTRIWATLPSADAIAELRIVDDGNYELRTHSLPAGSGPYDLACAGGVVWYTARGANRIGRLDPSTQPPTITEYDIPTPGSRPTSLAVSAGDPTRIWFTENAADQMGLLTVWADLRGEFEEYPLPEDLQGAELQDVTVQSAKILWVTAPAVQRVLRFSTDGGSFYPVPVGSIEATPWSVTMVGQYPWFTEPASGCIGSYNPSTLLFIPWRCLDDPASEPFDLVSMGDYLYFTQRGGHRVGRLPIRGLGRAEELALPGAYPNGIAADGDGALWIAAAGTHQLVRWRVPFFHRVHLPLVMSNRS